MMKAIKMLAALFVALVAMNSCVKLDIPVEEPVPTKSDETVKAKLFGTWYVQYDATGTINGKTYKSVVEIYQFPQVLGEVEWGEWNRLFFAEPGDENPIDDLAGGSGATGLFSYIVGSDGTIDLQLENLDLAVYSLSYYEPTVRTIHYADSLLFATGVDGRDIVLTLADDATERILYSWHVYLHGGDGEGGGTYETGISDEQATEPSRAPRH